MRGSAVMGVFGELRLADVVMACARKEVWFRREFIVGDEMGCC